MEKHSYTYR